MQEPNVPNIECKPADLSHSNCTRDMVPHGGSGPMTGRCAPEGRCEISGWCPTEMENINITYVPYGRKYYWREYHFFILAVGPKIIAVAIVLIDPNLVVN